MSFYLEQEALFDSSLYSTTNNDDFNPLSASFNLDDYPLNRSLSSNTLQAGPSSGTPLKQYPAYDPDSPFNSSIVPVKSVGRDGRLKTKLMGVGADGGFLTSPLILGKPRMGGAAGTPEIAIASPAPQHQPHDAYAGAELGDSLVDMGQAGMGIGISGLNGGPELGGEFASGSSSHMRAYGLPKHSRQRSTTSEFGFADPHLRHGHSGLGMVETMPQSPSKFVEHRFQTQSPPPLGSHLPYAHEVSQRPKKNLSVRTLNKAKSCSALSPSGARHPHEPLTPVSAQHSPSNFPVPGVPYNSPVDALINGVGDGSAMPFSFADLYGFGLAADSLDEIDPRKSPFAFATDLLGAENGTLGLGMTGQAGGDEFAMLHSLPTPSLAHGSGFSSPGTPFEASPELLGLGYGDGLGGQPMLNAPSMHSMPSMSSVGSMMSGSSLDDQYRARHGYPQAGRQQRAVSYQPTQMLDPQVLLSPPPMQSSGRQMSNQAAYGGANTKFSYPSRMAHGQSLQQQQQQYPAPPMSWTTSNNSDYSQIDTSQFLPAFDQQARQRQEDYQRNLDDFEHDMYDRYAQPGLVFATPHKAKRRAVDDGDEDEEDEIERAGEEFDYVSGGGEGASSGGRTLRHSASQKRLRTVASAPCLPSATRRMRPGPKPKLTKSPQEAHQSVFSAILSPPPPMPGFRRAASPYPSEGGGGSDDEGDGQSSLPKEYIQSLYRGVPSHTAANGTKVPKRYECLMDGCERTFPRKSAIESHIQTHLEDKPFICPHADCDASFVRQHDLRRHERIHSGNKPFPCPCGKGFARGDALARHRARGICSGSLVPRRA